MSDADRLITRVIQGGYCIGCGACAATDNAPFRIVLDSDGKLQASRNKQADSATNPCAVCPFSGEGDNEDVIGQELFSTQCQHKDGIGYYRALYGGYVSSESDRVRSASGGVTTWLLIELLRKGLIDGVAHVKPRQPTEENPLVLAYGISTTEEEIRRGAGSHYYPVEMSEVLRHIHSTNGRYAVVGVPKFITAVRLLMKADPIFNERIAYCIGIVAGHMKSKFYADAIGWQAGIKPGDLTGVVFRKARPNESSKNFDIHVKGLVHGKEREADLFSKQTFNYNDWGMKFFEYEAADFSDDHLAETADISLGDAWLPRYIKNWRGTSVIISRNSELDALLHEGVARGELHLDTLTESEVITTQTAGLRHICAGVNIRAKQKEAAGKWHPPVRNLQTPPISRAFPRVIAARWHIARESFPLFHRAIEHDSYDMFIASIQPLIRMYDKSRTTMYRWAGRLRRVLPFL